MTPPEAAVFAIYLAPLVAVLALSHQRSVRRDRRRTGIRGGVIAGVHGGRTGHYFLVDDRGDSL